MAVVVALTVGNRALTAVGQVRINLEDHLIGADGIRFEVPDGTAIANGEQVTVAVQDGASIYRFGPYTVNTVRTNEPEVTATQSRDDTLDASILDDLVDTHIYTRDVDAAERAEDPNGVTPNAARQAFFDSSDFSDGYSVDVVVGNDIKSRQNLADAVKAIRGQLFEVVRTSSGYTFRNVYDTFVNQAAVVARGGTTRVLDASELLGTIRGQGKWSALQGNITTDSVKDALERIRATYRTPNDERERSTPALVNARALPGNYTSLVLAADALARHILLDRVDGTTIDVQLRLDMSIAQGDVVSYESNQWQVVKLQHTLGPDVTDLTLKRVDLITETAIRTTYQAVEEYMLPDRPTALAQGTAEGNVTQAVWDSPQRSFGDGTSRSVDNVDGYVISRYINAGVTPGTPAYTTYGLWERPEDEHTVKTTSAAGYTNSERHAVPGRNAHILLDAPAGRLYPLEVRAYNEFGTSRVGIIATSYVDEDGNLIQSPQLSGDGSGQPGVALGGLPSNRTEPVVAPDLVDDRVIVLRTVNGFPILPTRSTVWGYQEYASAESEGELRLIPPGRVFEKRDTDFSDDDIPAEFKSERLILTPQTGFTVRSGSLGIISGVSSIGLIGVTGFIGTQATFTCSAVCVPAVQSFSTGILYLQRAQEAISQFGLTGGARATALANIVSDASTGLELGRASRIALNLGSTPRIAAAAVGVARVGSIFSGPVGWAISGALFPISSIIEEVSTKQGVVGQFIVDPSGWVFERVEFQYRWRDRSDRILNRQGISQGLDTDGGDLSWNDFPFSDDQADAINAVLPGAGQGHVDTLYIPRVGVTSVASAYRLDWLNEIIPVTDEQLEAVAEDEAPTQYNIALDGDRATLSQAFWMRQATQMFHHRYTGRPHTRWGQPGSDHRLPYDAQYRVRVVVDSQPGEDKAGRWDDYRTDWDTKAGTPANRDAVSGSQAKANGWLMADNKTLNPQYYDRCRYRASEWHYTGWIPFNRSFGRRDLALPQRQPPLE